MKKGHRTPGARRRDPTYPVWRAMVRRCTNPKCSAWPEYGGRGIAVCERWMTFENFVADMGAPPDGMQIERVDNDGPYSPANCRWATRGEQARNRRSTHEITFRGATKCLSEWARELGVSPKLLHHRIKAGWPIEQVMTIAPLEPRARRGQSSPRNSATPRAI